MSLNVVRSHRSDRDKETRQTGDRHTDRKRINEMGLEKGETYIPRVNKVEFVRKALWDVYMAGFLRPSPFTPRGILRPDCLR